jgi:DNA-binding LacI/PurR family transcriptional regulator
MKKLSIKDIAQKAGTCIGTVSRVINNLDRVHPETRERVQKIIKVTGYQPNSAGRALVSGRTNNVLVVLHNIADPYCASISKIFSTRLHELGCKMLLGDSNYELALEREHLARARDGGVDGLIVSPIPGRTNSMKYREMINSGFPFVAIDNRVEGVKTNCVKYDDHAAAGIAVEYLAGKGHKRIAFVQSRPEFQTVKDRLSGYRTAMQRLKLNLKDQFQKPVSHVLSESSAAITALMRMKQAPTAFIAENEIMALVCMNTLLQAGFRIPHDVAVIGIGDTLSEHFAPIPLTTVSLRQDRMCERAVGILKQLIDGPKPARHNPTQEIIQPELVIRASA